MMGRKIKDSYKKGLRILLEIGQHFGFNILPCHFYSEIPNFKELRRNEYWKKPRSMIGVHGTDIESQFAFIKECCCEDLIERQRKGDIYDYCRNENGEPGFGPAEADFLYCFIYTKRPNRIIQVGAGLSTAVMLLASEESHYKPEIICVDPYPNKFLEKSDRANKIRLIPRKVQLVDLEMLTELGSNGLLFIDSTHTVKPGSDVNYLILEVLPRLKEGIWVHFHDIYFPFDYSRDILGGGLFFSNESVFLHTFLIDNPRYTLRASLGMLHYANPSKLQKFLPNYRPSRNSDGLRISEGHFPSSAYLRVIR
jgi:hypothetical protein